MNRILKSTYQQLSNNQTINNIVRNYTSKTKNNQPRLKKTTMICSNGATVPIWTALPHGKIWRTDVDCFSNSSTFEMDSIKEIKKKREKELEDKLRMFDN